MSTYGHTFKNSNPSGFDSNCIVCEGKHRDAIHGDSRFMPDETPLEWGDLFAAMEPTPHRWVRTTPEMYWAMLEAVPPQDMGKGGFLVGEADHHNASGEAVYSCFTESAGDYFQARYMTQAEFTGWKAIRS